MKNRETDLENERVLAIYDEVAVRMQSRWVTPRPHGERERSAMTENENETPCPNGKRHRLVTSQRFFGWRICARCARCGQDRPHYLEPATEVAAQVECPTITSAKTWAELESILKTIGYDTALWRPKVGDRVLINTVAMQGRVKHGLVTALCPKDMNCVQVVLTKTDCGNLGRVLHYNIKRLIPAASAESGPSSTAGASGGKTNCLVVDRPEPMNVTMSRKRAEGAETLDDYYVRQAAYEDYSASLESLAEYIGCAHVDDVFNAVRFKIDCAEREVSLLQLRVTDLQGKIRANAPERMSRTFKVYVAYYAVIFAFFVVCLGLVKITAWLF